jgi:DNA-binding CsgD family transcriptional regulator
VRRWLDAQRGAGASGLELRLARPLHATVDSLQLILRYLPGVAGGVDAILMNVRTADASTAATMRGVGLSDRELEVLALVGTGSSNSEIADRLSLSVWTIKRHLANIYAKLGVNSRVRAAAVALEIAAHHQD